MGSSFGLGRFLAGKGQIWGWGCWKTMSALLKLSLFANFALSVIIKLLFFLHIWVLCSDWWPLFSRVGGVSFQSSLIPHQVCTADDTLCMGCSAPPSPVIVVLTVLCLFSTYCFCCVFFWLLDVSASVL